MRHQELPVQQLAEIFSPHATNYDKGTVDETLTRASSDLSNPDIPKHRRNYLQDLLRHANGLLYAHEKLHHALHEEIPEKQHLFNLNPSLFTTAFTRYADLGDVKPQTPAQTQSAVPGQPQP